MSSLVNPTVTYDITLMLEDMAAKGFIQKDLASRARVSAMVVSRFLSGERQTARMAKKLAAALGHPVRRYIVSARMAEAS